MCIKIVQMFLCKVQLKKQATEPSLHEFKVASAY